MKNIKQTAAKLQQYGRNGDTMLAHITPEEASLLKRLGGSGTINPKTGLPEYFLGGVVSAIGNVVGSVGGFISGSKAADAAKGQAEALRAAGERAYRMARFNPIGIRTGFGSSEFELGPDGKLVSAGYTLDPRLASLRESFLSGAAGYDPTRLQETAEPLYGGVSSLFNLGQSYLGQNPQEIAERFMTQRQALLAPSRKAQFAGLRSREFGRGTGGLGVQTGTGTAPTNPAMQAYFNSIARQDQEIAAQAEEEARRRIQFGGELYGAGSRLAANIPSLFSTSYLPIETQLALAGTTERMGQQPFQLSQDLARLESGIGSSAASLFMQPQVPAANAYAQYQGYSPMGSFLSNFGPQISGGSGLFSNPNQYGGLFGGGRVPTSSTGFESWESPYIS